MKYYIDTEFSEHIRKPFFGKPYHRIELISIGIVAEDGRQYYAVSNEFSYRHCNDWVKKNVLSKLPDQHFNGSNISDALLYKSNKQIADDIISFTNYPYILASGQKRELMVDSQGSYYHPEKALNSFYGYFADYDWVVLCSLYGAMVNLPKGFPYYCMDLKQMMHERGLNKEWKEHNCPDPDGEHDALVDATWNKMLHEKILQTEKSNSL